MAEDKNVEDKLVRQSYCKECDGFVRTMALEHVDSNMLKEFEKEVEKYDLGVETLKVSEWKEKNRDFCECDEDEEDD